MKKVVGFVVLFLFTISLSEAGIYLGVVDGYIKDVDGNPIYNANVSLFVNGCSGDECYGSALSEPTGYYIIYNLNLPASGTVSLSAIKVYNSTVIGSVSNVQATADAYQIVHKNLTICYPPSMPTLFPAPDAHTKNFTFTWTSGIDPFGKLIYDQFKLDSESFYNATSSLTRTNLDFGTHTWYIRTCNNYCCSSASSDIFTAINNAPTVPTNITATDLGNNKTSLAWISGTDPDGDNVYDEVYWNGTLYPYILSPFNVTTELLIEWKVRTCDIYNSCSDWVEQSSVMCGAANLTCPSCPPCICGGRSKTPITNIPKTKIYCNGILYSEDYLVSISIDTRSKRLSIIGMNESFRDLDLEYCMWCTNGKQDGDESYIDCGGSCPPCKGIHGEETFPSIPFTKIPIIAEIPQVRKIESVMPSYIVNNIILSIICVSIAVTWLIVRYIIKIIYKIKIIK